MSVNVCHVHVGTMEARKVCQIPWNGCYKHFCDQLDMGPGIRVWSSERAELSHLSSPCPLSFCTCCNGCLKSVALMSEVEVTHSPGIRLAKPLLPPSVHLRPASRNMSQIHYFKKLRHPDPVMRYSNGKHGVKQLSTQYSGKKKKKKQH